MNTLLLALQLLVADTSDHPFPYAIRSQCKPLDYRKYEVQVSQAYRDSVLNTFKIRYDDYFNDEYINSKKFTSSFHFVHLNKDQWPDLVYAGWTGGEGNATHIYINRVFSFEKVLDDYHDLIDWQFENKRLSAVVIYELGCCGALVEAEKLFRADSLFNFNLVRRREICVGMSSRSGDFIAPDEYFKEPVSFKTINNDYALRFSPQIIDKPRPEYETEFTKGNVLALFPKGAKGIAWGSKTDASGRVWWLVEMEPQDYLSFKIYHGDENPTSYYGWMSSRFLEKTP